MVIFDDGVGFDKKIFKASTGIKSMEARALKMKGNINIESSVGNGTKIELIL
jgi:signal transduction histidine kinase